MKVLEPIIFRMNFIHRNAIVVSLLLPLLLVNSVHAENKITPFVFIEHAFVENTTETVDESGQITRIAPGVSYVYAQSRLNLELDYAYNIIVNSGLEAENREEHNLRFLTQLDHIPNRWSSRLSASISQQDVDSEGTQIVNDLFTSSNTEELRTVGLNSAYQGFFDEEIRYFSGFNIDHADYENQNDSQSLSLNLGVNNSTSVEKLTWNADLDSEKFREGSTDEQISTLNLGLNYRISSKYSTFISSETVDTDNDNFDDTSSLIGLWWQPSRNSFFKIGVGEKNDDTSYSLDSTFIRKRLSLSINYSEEVTTSRSLSLLQIVSPSGVVTSSETLSVTPILVKRGSIDLVMKGRRTDIAIAYFDQVENIDDVDSEDEKTDGISITVSRKLSRHSTLDFNASRENIETTEDDTIKDIKLSYNRRWSKTLDSSFAIQRSQQISDDADDEYDQKSISFTLKGEF